MAARRLVIPTLLVAIPLPELAVVEKKLAAADIDTEVLVGPQTAVVAALLALVAVVAQKDLVNKVAVVASQSAEPLIQGP